MKDHRDARDQRQDGADGQAKTVEGGQRVEQLVRIHIKADMGAHLFDICHDVLMAQNNALWFAFSTRGKKHHAWTLVARLATDQARRQRTYHGCELVFQGQVLADVFEINDLGHTGEVFHQGFKASDFDEFACGDNLRHFGRPHGRFQIAGTGCEVQHRRNAIVSRQCIEADHRTRAGWQHDSH